MSLILSLPQEIIEEILIICAFYGSPSSIASLAQSCCHFRDIICDTTDNHLWREIYLSTFDDPRPLSNCLHTPLGRNAEEENPNYLAFDWKVWYQRRVKSRKVLRKGIFAENGSDFDPLFLQESFEAVISAIETSSIQTSCLVEKVSLKEFLQSISSNITSSSSTSLNIVWLTECLSAGFVPTLVHKLIDETPIKGNSPQISLYKQVILLPSWDYTEAGEAFYKLVFHTGFRPLLRPSTEESFSALHSLQPASEFRSLLPDNSDVLTTEKQRSLARAAARRRVYSLPYLSSDRCWGPFLSLRDNSEEDSIRSKRRRRGGNNQRFPASEIEELLTGENFEDDLSPQESAEFVQGMMDNFRLFFQELEGSTIARQTVEEEDEEDDSNTMGMIEVSTPHSSAAGSATTSGRGSPSHDTEDPYAEPHADPLNITDVDDEVESLLTQSQSPLPGFVSATKTRYPMYPDYAHLLKPDYVFLSAARTIVQVNLLERFDAAEGSVPVWPWFTNEDAVHATRVLLDSLSGLDGLDGLRMGSAPGFWDGINGEERRRGWGLVDEGEAEGVTSADGTDARSSKPAGETSSADRKAAWHKETGINLEAERKRAKAKDPDLELTDDGWDWAGIEGKWIRAACWMDYRDLLFLNLRVSGSSMAEDIQETCVVFPMDLVIIGYSRVQPPQALPPSTDSDHPSSLQDDTPSSSRDKGKGKAKAEDFDDSDTPGTTSTQQPYNPLVYTLPIIHVSGKYGGTQHVIRVARGTVRMIGDGNVRWSLVTSDAGSGREEWVMEGVQIGGIGSALGVAGMWTGAMHEKGDPLGPTWAWKVA